MIWIVAAWIDKKLKADLGGRDEERHGPAQYGGTRQRRRGEARWGWMRRGAMRIDQATQARHGWEGRDSTCEGQTALGTEILVEKENG